MFIKHYIIACIFRSLHSLNNNLVFYVQGPYYKVQFNIKRLTCEDVHPYLYLQSGPHKIIPSMKSWLILIFSPSPKVVISGLKRLLFNRWRTILLISNSTLILTWQNCLEVIFCVVNETARSKYFIINHPIFWRVLEMCVI